MKKAIMIAMVLAVAVISTACINNIAVQELNNKASEYMQKGDYESAMSRLQASLDLDATIYETYYNLGIAAINANKYDIALDAINKGIKIKPDFANFYYALGLAQSGKADDIIDGIDIVQSKSTPAVEEEETPSKNIELTPADKQRAVEYKRTAAETLTKYIQMKPNAEDKQSVEDLIKECNIFVDSNEIKSQQS